MDENSNEDSGWEQKKATEQKVRWNTCWHRRTSQLHLLSSRHGAIKHQAAAFFRNMKAEAQLLFQDLQDFNWCLKIKASLHLLNSREAEVKLREFKQNVCCYLFSLFSSDLQVEKICSDLQQRSTEERRVSLDADKQNHFSKACGFSLKKHLTYPGKSGKFWGGAS